MKKKQKLIMTRSDHIFRKKIVKYGNGAHINMPKRFLGQDVLVVVIEKPKEDVQIVLSKKRA